MQKIYSKGFNGWSQLAIFLGLAGGGLIIASIVSIPVWKMMTNGSLLNMEQDMLKPENANAALIIQAISAVFAFFLPAVAFAFICFKNSWGFLGFKEKINPKLLLIVVLILVCSLPMTAFLGELNKMIPISNSARLKFDNMEKKYNDMVLAMVQLKTWGQYFVSLLIIAVLPGITEEVLFRGGLQNMLTRWLKSPWAAILITSVLFSAVHLSWYGFLARFALGVVLGLIFHHTKNIWLNILAHFLNNGIAVTIMFVMVRQGKPIDMAAQESYPWVVGIVAVALVIVLLRWLIKSSPKPVFDENDTDYFDRNNPFDERNKMA